MSVKPVSDIAKDAKDVLELDYPSTELKLTVQSKTSDGLSLKGIIDAVDISKSRFESKYELNSEIEISTKFFTSKDVTGSAIVKNIFSDKLKFEGNLNSFVKKPSSASAAFTFVLPKVLGKVALLTPLDPNKLGELSFEVSCQPSSPLQLGVSGTYGLSDSVVTGEGVVAFSHEKFTAAGRTVLSTSANHKRTIGLSIFSKLSDNHKIAFNILNKADSSTFAVGLESKLNTNSSAKAKFNLSQEKKSSDYRLVLSTKQKLTNNFTATLSSDINAQTLVGLSNTSPNHSFGAEFKLDL